MRYYYAVLIMLAIANTTAAATLEAGYSGDDSLVLAYTGAWASTDNAQAIDGSFTRSASIADVVSFETYAPGFLVHFVSGPGSDDMQICVVDDCIVVSTLGATSKGKVEVSDLAGGLKTVTIRKATDNGAPLNFDGVYIYPSPSGNSATISEITVGDSTISGELLNQITSGDAMLSVLLTVLIVLNVGQIIAGWLQS